MLYRFHIGVDVSKKTVDVTILMEGGFLLYNRITNDTDAINLFLYSLKKEYGVSRTKAVFCLENTGLYTVSLLKALKKAKYAVWLEHPLNIKLSLGMQRGKSDKIDSKRIAHFAYTNEKNIKLWLPPRDIIEKLRLLRALRMRLISCINIIKVESRETKALYPHSIMKGVNIHSEQSLISLENDLHNVDVAIKQTIENDMRLFNMYQWVNSVVGVGKVLAVEFIIATNEFKNFSCAKKFACYSGIAPFSYSSGTSLNSKAKVSKRANRRLKSILHMASISVIRLPGELQVFYRRKLSEGKSKMSVLNIIKNKIVHRVFACVREERRYDESVNSGNIITSNLSI